MATDLTENEDAPEGLLVLTKQGSTGFRDLDVGQKVRFYSTNDPDVHIDVTVASPAEVMRIAATPGGFFSWERQPPIQTFTINLGKDLQLWDRDAPLTSSALANEVVPIVSALSRIQQVLFGSELRIRAISQNSPVNISLEGAAQLYEKVANDIIPWRRKHAKELAAHADAQSHAELERKRAEVLEAEATSEIKRAEAVQAWQIAREAKATADLRELELRKARYRLAIDLITELHPDASEVERVQMIAQLEPELARITSAPSVLSIGGSPET